MGNLFLARDLNAPIEVSREAVKMAKESQRLFLNLLRKWRCFTNDAEAKPVPQRGPDHG